MNDADLDALAGRAAAHARAEARAVADSEAALARLLADAAAEVPEPAAPVIPYHGPIRDVERRRRWQLVAVAAVVGVFAVGIGYALVSGSGTIEVAGPPAAGTGTGPARTVPMTAPTTGPSTAPPAPTAPITGSAATPSPSEPTATPTDPTTATAEGTSRETVVLVAQDPFEGWAAPALRPRLLDEVPYLVPGDGRWDGAEVFRSEWESGETDATFTQVWVRTLRASTTVDGVLVLTSRLGPMPAVAGETVEIAGWPTSVERETGAGVVTFDVASPTGSVTVWALGLSRADVIAITSSLRTDGEAGAGWLFAAIANEPWNELDAGRWSVGFASRSARLVGSTGLTATEVTAVSGLSIGEVGPGLLGSELGITEVGDRIAMTFADATRSAVVWVRADGVTVSVGSLDPLDTTLDLAGALGEVDRATWEASTVPDPDFGDGCSGLFC